MRQKGVTKEALAFIKKEYKAILDKQDLRPIKAFRKPKGDIKDINLSGRTIRKIFTGEHVHVNTIEAIIESLGRKTCVTNGKIDLKNEEDNSETIQEQEQKNGGTRTEGTMQVDKEELS